MLGGKADGAGVDARGRLADDDAPRPCPCRQMNELAVAIEEAGGWIENVEKNRTMAAQTKRWQHAQRHLLITRAEVGAAVAGY